MEHAFYCFDKWSCFTLDLWQTTSALTTRVNYTTTRQWEIQNFQKFFPDFLRAQNMVRVIEDKII